MDVHYLANREQPTPERVDFWLTELRTAVLLIGAVGLYPDRAHAVAATRVAVARACTGSAEAIETGTYWGDHYFSDVVFTASVGPMGTPRSSWKRRRLPERTPDR